MIHSHPLNFDPTNLLMIKDEVNRIFTLVETNIINLSQSDSRVHDLEEASFQLSQCEQVLKLIHTPNMAHFTHCLKQLLDQMKQSNAEFVDREAIEFCSSLEVIRRFIDFSCLHQVSVPLILLDSMNRIESILNMPLSEEGTSLEHQLHSFSYSFNLPFFTETYPLEQLSLYFKKALLPILQTQKIDQQELSKIAESLVTHSLNLPSERYWQCVYLLLSELHQAVITEARQRLLIQIERNISQFCEQPALFTPHSHDLCAVLSVFLRFEHDTADKIRKELDISSDYLTEAHFKKYLQHFKAPEPEIFQVIKNLLNDGLNDAINTLQDEFSNISPDALQQLSEHLHNYANVFKVLNLPLSAERLESSSQKLKHASLDEIRILLPELTQDWVAALNEFAFLERQQHSSKSLLPIINPNISLNILDQAHEALCLETQILIEQVSDQFIHTESGIESNQQDTIQKMKEIAAALSFLDIPQGSESLTLVAKNLPDYSVDASLSEQILNHILDVLACAHLSVRQIQTKHPRTLNIFNPIFQNTQHLMVA